MSPARAMRWPGSRLAALMQGLDLETAVRQGMRAAKLTVASSKAVVDLRRKQNYQRNMR